MQSVKKNLTVLAACCAFVFLPEASDAQTVLFDFGNDNSFRGLSASSPDSSGLYWNSLQTGAFYADLVDVNNVSTSIDFGFSTAVATDSYNGPAGATNSGTLTTDVLNTDIDSAALGQLGGSLEAAFDFVAGPSGTPSAVRFEIQQLDPAKTYDLTFFGSHKFSADSTTVYNIYSDNTYATLVDSVSLNHQNPLSPSQHNRAGLATISGVAPQASNILYVEFVGQTGNPGYLNAMRLQEAQANPPTSPKLYMHYMPWFDTPSVLGSDNWGLHWTGSGARDPNVIDSEGKRQIASNYYPKIGPYQSSDPDVIEYHMLLMKMAGVEGILIDWYGVQGTNGDIARLFNNSNAIADSVDDYGLEFGVVLEDRFAANTGQVQTNVEWLENNYFNRPEYIRIGPGDDPILPVFGPITQQQPSAWDAVLQNVQDVELLPLWFQSGEAGANATGEYAWIFENESLDDYLVRLESFYQNNAPGLGTVGAIAYPGFDAFDGASFTIPHDDGQTLANTLALAREYESAYDFLQLATFNDFGEGTIFEPTIETGFDYLIQLQQFTGVAYGEAELQLVFDLFRARKEFSADGSIQTLLDQASAHLGAFEISHAQAIIESIYVPGDFDDDGDADGSDFLAWQRQLGAVNYDLLGLAGADGNADGLVDELDLASWQSHFGLFPVAAHSFGNVVPEPASLATCAVVFGMGMLSRRRRR